VANDHWLKAAWPGPVTGKLSDVAGLVLAPLVLQAAVEVVTGLRRPAWRPSRAVLVGSVAIVGTVFAAINLFPLAADAYRVGLGAAQWPFRALAAVLASAPIPAVAPVALVLDPTDLVTLPGLLVPLVLGWRRAERLDRTLPGE
jgi:hypothetical protein